MKPFFIPRVSNQAGMSLIEIMVVVALMGGIMALAGMILFPGDEAKLREHATKLVGSMKYVYNEAAIKNKYYRFVINLDEGSYHVESSTEPFTVSRKSPTEGPVDLEGEEGEVSNPENNFAAESNYLMKPVKLPDGIKFKDITVLHVPERLEQGIAHVYFLPNGWAEPMVLNITDEDEEYFYSLELNPLTGRSIIREEYYEVDPEKFRQDQST